MKLSWISVLITLFIVYLAVTNLDFLLLFDSLQTINLVLVGTAFIIWFVLVVFKAVKWQQIVFALKGKMGFIKSLAVLQIGLFISVATPGRLGDFVRAAYLKDQLSVGKGVMAVVMDRVIDVLELLFFSIIGLYGLFITTGIFLITAEVLIVIILVAIVGTVLLFNRSFVSKIVKPIISKILPKNIFIIIKQYGSEFYDSIPLLKQNIGNVLGAIILGIIAWVITVTFGWILMQAVGIQLDWTVALLVIPVMALIEIIPFGVAGIGTRELAAVIILGAYGIAPEQAVLFSLLYFIMGYVPSFIFGSIIFNMYPLPIKGGLKGVWKRYKIKPENHS
jgi:uncharacterized protein (TIRG00374 family)